MSNVDEKKQSNFVNAILYSSESISALLFSIVSLALIARHFGPENFARYSLAQSVSTLFIVLATLGLEQFIIRELARNERNEEYVSTMMIGMFMGWLLYVGCVVGYYLAFHNLEHDLVLILSVVLSTLLLKVFFIRSFLQAQNKPKPIAIASLASRVVSIAYLFFGTYLNFSYNSMMLYLPLQALIFAWGMTASQMEFVKFVRFKYFNFTLLRASLKEASPIFISTALYFFYSQTDILLMASLLDAKTVGIYSASIRLIPQAAFIGFILVATFYRQMDQKLLSNKDEFYAYVKTVLTVQIGLGIVLAATVCIASDLIIYLLYGEQYAESAKVLAIACWAWIFVFPAALFTRMLVMLGLARYDLIKMLIVAPIVVCLNYVVITQVGMVGAAYVYVLSFFLVDFLIYFMFKETRPFALLGVRAFVDVFAKPRETMAATLNLFKARH
jgi:O-antigen/teichoic acid export membrane protein